MQEDDPAVNSGFPEGPVQFVSLARKNCLLVPFVGGRFVKVKKCCPPDIVMAGFVDQSIRLLDCKMEYRCQSTPVSETCTVPFEEAAIPKAQFIFQFS